ncbi:helix-turn-helix transcriptional regulator [Ottowia testudinis]|uniref:Helix-turn-helix transcriptional regulator n=1 Tax=Ottowia testudinis TaxID=2816950 RepID=A0A975CK86_9BURK|nr:helix-turn-helix transcriptional regulator [Ottowia testudinis]QTD46522.1 helix-turn-helix transcriptional regulator [Ottowia testudinis]
MFGLRLSAERRRLGLSQQQVADRLGVSRSAVGMLETDRAALEVERLLKLSEIDYDVLKVLTDEPARLAAGRLLDWQLVVDVVERVTAWEQARGLRLPSEKKALVIKHLYLRFAAQGVVDKQALDETLQMAA